MVVMARCEREGADKVIGRKRPEVPHQHLERRLLMLPIGQVDPALLLQKAPRRLPTLSWVAKRDYEASRCGDDMTLVGVQKRRRPPVRVMRAARRILLEAFIQRARARACWSQVDAVGDLRRRVTAAGRLHHSAECKRIFAARHDAVAFRRADSRLLPPMLPMLLQLLLLLLLILLLLLLLLLRLLLLLLTFAFCARMVEPDAHIRKHGAGS